MRVSGSLEALVLTRYSRLVSGHSNFGFMLRSYWKADHFQIEGGSRMDSAKAYLAAALFRPNLDVLVHTMVTKIVQTDAREGIPVFRGVEFAQSAFGRLIQGQRR